MSSRFPTVVILITAAAFAGFAIWLTVMPNALLEAFGIAERTPQMATEIRAFYGGIEFGIAAAMFVLWLRGDLFAALLIGGLPLAGSATGRCIGMMADGFFGLHAGFAVMEAIAAVLCFVGCAMVSRGNSDG
ncbi:hypothetical protein Poly24_29760 [Rosistilla carotiformis]|uniref:DUF4345 domain-containing protein n=1 Tax=Rosistilla carotiformis TaxID=2528017 RepID=A0A518JUN0_9BACT|nr:DUF4345 family protein [Rosistilla carotiformis]QDV69261.1 hypothetical protein Poly24_29760 [Rosistilla carotiformis]